MIRILKWRSSARGKVTVSLKRVHPVMGGIKKREVRAEELRWGFRSAPQTKSRLFVH